MGDRPIFLSYARVDDEVASVERNLPGWVRFFHDHLRVALRQRISRDIHFWRDVEDIEPDARFAPEIEEALRQAMLMVAVVSPNYLERPWCHRELHTFVGLLTGVDDDTRAERVIKVLKHNVPEEALPAPLRNRGRGYRFFEIDPGRRIEMPYFMAGRLLPRHEQAYFDLINEITERLAARIRASVSVPEAPAPAPEAPTCTVFVAVPPVGSSIREVHIALAAELRRQGIAVVPQPEEAFPDALPDAERLLKHALEPAVLAVHLVGESGGKVCDGADEPMVHLQLRRSAEEMKHRPGLKRLIWLPSNLHPTSDRHAQFLDGLRKFDSARLPLLPGRDDVVSDTFDGFLAQVQRILGAAAGQRPAAPAAEPPSLYVVAADEDVALARGELRKLLRATRAVVGAPLPVSQPADKRDAHEAEGLRDADLAVVLWGSRDVAWVEDQLRRLRRWERLGRSRALRTIALLVAGSDTDEKRDEDPTAAAELHIDLRGGLDSEALAPLDPFLGPRT